MKAKVFVIFIIRFIIWSTRFGVTQDISKGGKSPKMSYWFYDLGLSNLQKKNSISDICVCDVLFSWKHCKCFVEKKQNL